MSNHANFPWWLKPANRIIISLYRLGWAFGTWYVLSIPGRKTGKMRSTPVSMLRVDGQRYIMTGLETNWVKNARAAGWGFLTRGGKKERVALIKLPVEERALMQCSGSDKLFQAWAIVFSLSLSPGRCCS